MSWWLTPAYSPLEMAVAIILAALPMSQLAQIALGVLEQKTGIDIKKDK